LERKEWKEEQDREGKEGREGGRQQRKAVGPSEQASQAPALGCSGSAGLAQSKGVKAGEPPREGAQGRPGSSCAGVWPARSRLRSRSLRAAGLGLRPICLT